MAPADFRLTQAERKKKCAAQVQVISKKEGYLQGGKGKPTSRQRRVIWTQGAGWTKSEGSSRRIQVAEGFPGGVPGHSLSNRNG